MGRVVCATECDWEPVTADTELQVGDVLRWGSDPAYHWEILRVVPHPAYWALRIQRVDGLDHEPYLPNYYENWTLTRAYVDIAAGAYVDIAAGPSAKPLVQRMAASSKDPWDEDV